MVIQGNKEKEIGELSTSNNDTQARSQSLNTKIIPDKYINLANNKLLNTVDWSQEIKNWPVSPSAFARLYI